MLECQQRGGQNYSIYFGCRSNATGCASPDWAILIDLFGCQENVTRRPFTPVLSLSLRCLSLSQRLRGMTVTLSGRLSGGLVDAVRCSMWSDSWNLFVPITPANSSCRRKSLDSFLCLQLARDGAVCRVNSRCKRNVDAMYINENKRKGEEAQSK